MKRRTFLSGAALAALAGCSGNTGTSGGSGDGGSDGDDGTGGSGGSSGPNPDEARTALDSQPTLGPAPGDAPGLIVAFEDPSCTRCRAFDRNVFPEIRSNLVETGAATFVFRGYPVVYEWGNPASHALEATFTRDADAFWALTSHYFENQSDFRGKSAADVYEGTESFLAAETDLDAAAVVSDAQGEAAASAVQTDLDAGTAAGAGRTTPHLFLFRDGEFQTKAAGSVSYDTIEAVLQV
ncbi:MULTISPECIES: DsbA family protein [Salinibaculum]|uniref:DsbA family protein n=1 Tax=Salinibaculum TaxID=2732368 RepID=UPI0030CFE074